nr:terminase TerL endonuclease subunit [Rhizobium sp. ACO-34A]
MKKTLTRSWSSTSEFPVMRGLEWLYDGSEIPDHHGRADRAIRFLRLLKHSKSRLPGQQLQIDPWQERIIRKIYGPSDEFGNRLIRQVYLQVGKGSRKTSLSAILAVLHVVGPERVNRGQSFVVAHAMENAKETYNELEDIVTTTPALNAAMRVKKSRLQIAHPKSKSGFTVISSDSDRSQSISPNFMIIDELWAHKKTATFQSAKGALAKVSGSLMVIATTAGRGREGPDFAEYQYASQVRDGEIEDPTFLPIIFEAEEDDVIDDPAVWHKVMPGLRHGYPDLPMIRKAADQAHFRPAERAFFEQFYLGRRQDNSLTPFIPSHVLDLGRQPINLDEFRGEPCWIGLDCSSTRDLTGLVAAFRRGDEYHCKAWAFCPGEGISERGERDRVAYPYWAEQGWLIPAGRSAIDYSVVLAKIRELIAVFEVREVACDIKFAQPIVGPLIEDGVDVVSLPQGWVTQSPALNILEKAAYDRLLKWDSPVLAWCLDNVAIQQVDSSGNRLMHKGKSRDRIDLASALWMAVSRAAASESEHWLSDPDLDVSKFFADLRS